MSPVWTMPSAFAQNSPPKAESDCGVSSMCTTPTTAVVHHGTPLWAAELVMFVVVVAVLLLAYRLLSYRAGSTSKRSA
jgi:hypothetical protein